MAFNGSGVFNRLYNWVNDAANGINIRADRMDAELNGIATGLSNCLTKDGQTTVLANLPMSGYRHTNVGDALLDNQYATLGQLNAKTLAGLDGMAISTPATNDILSYNGTDWTNAPPKAIAIAGSSSSAASFSLAEDTDNGTNKVTVIAPAAIASDRTITLPDASGTVALLETVLEVVYPVGSLYISETVSTNPNTILGFGTWVAIEGKMIIGANGTYTAGSTGGSATTTQTESTMAAHTHSIATYDNSGATGPRAAGVSTGNSGSINTNSAGSGSAMTTISPYHAFYMWRRTA